MTNKIRTTMLVLVLTQGAASCGDSASLPPYTSEPTAGASPSVAAIEPNVGSTGGDTPLIVTGTGFQPGSTVTFGGITVEGRVDRRDPTGTIMYLESPPHAEGVVDVVVTTPSGRRATLTRGYTFAPPQSFDFNGSWAGFGNAGQDIPILFTIEDNRLTSVSCDTYATLTFSDPPPVSNGEFSYTRADGVAVSGRIVSAYSAVGTIELPPCTATVFGVTRMTP